MKKLFLSLLLLTSLHPFCQDILVLKSGDELKVKVSEILPDVVKYKKWDNQDGPVYSEAKANIFMVKYQNGTKDIFANTVATNNNNSNTVNKFLGDWRCNIGSGGIVNEGDELKITIEGGNLTVALSLGGKSVQNTGTYENDKIKVSFPVIGETEITYSKITDKPSLYVFGTEMQRSLKSSSEAAFTGVISLDTTQAIISVIFKSISDEIVSHEEVLTNKILDLLKSNKRIKTIGASGVNINNVNLRYQLQYQLTTFYSSKPSILVPGSNAYSADIRLELFVFKLDKNGNRILGLPAENKLVHMKQSALGGGYVSKQGAFDALLNQINNPFYQQLYSMLPVNATITEITDASKKGDPKTVKISSGINQGVMKDSKFRVIDDNRKNEDYDLEVDQLFDDYSICDVKNNESVIADRFKANDKIRVTTDLDPKTENDIENYKPKTDANSKIVKTISGSWYGNLTVKGLKKPVSMQLTCNYQFRQFKANYPTYACGGNWYPKKSTDLSIDFRESITLGMNACESGTLITATYINDNQIEVEYFDPKSKKSVAKGTLTKE